VILVTGATGTTGLEAVRALVGRGAALRALARDPKKATALALPGVEVVAGDFGDADSLRRALSGVTHVLLLSPPVPDLHLLEKRFLDLAREERVVHVVMLSAVGAGPSVPHRFGRWHGISEKNLEASGIAWTHLRPNFFMQNLLGQVDAVRAGMLCVPAGTGKAPFVDCRDIGAVAAACLVEAGHRGKTYEVSGPAAIGYDEIAATLSRVLARPVSYLDVSAEAARKAMTDAGMPAWLADALGELNEQMKLGRFAAVSSAVRDVTGREPRSFEQFVRDHATSFA